jgi:hypothetical protein
MRLAALLVQDICGYIVERRVNDSAVHRIFPTDMILRGCELRSAGFAIELEIDMQANRVIRPAGKAHGRRFNLD